MSFIITVTEDEVNELAKNTPLGDGYCSRCIVANRLALYFNTPFVDVIYSSATAWRDKIFGTDCIGKFHHNANHLIKYFDGLTGHRERSSKPDFPFEIIFEK